MPAGRDPLVQGDPEGLAGRDAPDLAHQLHPGLGAFRRRGGNRGLWAAGDHEGVREDREGAAEGHCGADYPTRAAEVPGTPQGHLTRVSTCDVWIVSTLSRRSLS